MIRKTAAIPIRTNNNRPIPRSPRRNFRCASNNDSSRQVIVRGSIPVGGKGVAVGQFAESDRIFTAEDVNLFGKLVGDQNPLHQQWEMDRLPDLLENHPMVHAANEDDHGDGNHTKKTKILVHGILVSSLFSSIFGTLIPGAVYLKQSLDFARPVFVDESVTGRIIIERIRQWRRKGLILNCNTIVHSGDEEKIRGKADVWLPRGTVAGDS